MDLNLRINGDASGAREAFDEAAGAAGQLGDDVGKSVVKWQALVAAAETAVKAVVKFGVDSVKAYAESERIQKQLERAASSYSAALDNQAKALSRLYAVDDDVIKQSQILLTQWGGVGAATADVEKAALNLAAAFGTDLNTATSDLIRNVESGGTGLGKLGIHFKTTGDKGKDLAAAVAAINGKLGGAASADADSLTGQIRAAELAFEDMKKAIGGSIAELIRVSGIVPRLTKEIRELNDSLLTPTATKQEESKDFIAQQVQYWEDIAAGNVIGYKDFATKTQFTFEEAQAELAKWRAKMRPDDFNLTGGKGAPGVTGSTNKGMKDAAASAKGKTQAELDDASLEAAKKFQRSLDEIDEHAEARAQAETERVWKLAEEEEKARNARAATALAFDEKMAKEEDERRLAAEKEAAKLEAEAIRDTTERAAKQAQAAQSAGDAIGSAFVNALSSQLEKMSQGGEFDVAIFVGEIIASAVAVAGTVIGSAYGQPALGAALGNLAAMGVRAGAGAISAANHKKPRTMHDGGWVGDEIGLPRYHSGAWIGSDERAAILQTGERVLARNEVHHMGGPAAVDRMARGGGPTIVNHIQAIDSKNAAESFMADLGLGMKRALRTGHGDVPRLLGVAPR